MFLNITSPIYHLSVVSRLKFLKVITQDLSSLTSKQMPVSNYFTNYSLLSWVWVIRWNKRNDKKVRQESRSSQRLHSPVSSVTLEQMSDGSFELVPLANVVPPNHHPLSSTTPHESGDALLRSLVATRISLISCSLSLPPSWWICWSCGSPHGPSTSLSKHPFCVHLLSLVSSL